MSFQFVQPADEHPVDDDETLSVDDAETLSVVDEETVSLGNTDSTTWKLGRSLEEERVVHEEQDERIAELESFQKQLGLEQKAHSVLIDSVTLKIKELAAQINSLSRRGEIRDTEFMKLTQRFKETNAECSMKFEDSHKRRAEDQKICQNNNERCSQLEELMQRFAAQIAETNVKLSEFESEHALHTRKSEGQDDRIADLEFFQKQLGLERKAQSEQIDSELEFNTCKIEELAVWIASLSCKGEVRVDELTELAQRFKESQTKHCTRVKLNRAGVSKAIGFGAKAQSEQIESEHASRRCEIEGLRAQIDILSRDKEIRNNDLRKLTQCLEQTSAELNVKLEESHKWNAKVFEICRKNTEWCSQLEELTLTRQELIEVGVKSHASAVQDLIAMFIKPTEDLTSCFGAGYADREEKQKEQNQAEISSRTLETTSQKKLIEAESMPRMLTAQSSDHESPDRHMQLQNLESCVKAEITTRADTIQEHKTHLEAAVCYFVRIGVPFVFLFFLNRTRIETLAHSIVVGFAAQILPKCRGE